MSNPSRTPLREQPIDRLLATKQGLEVFRDKLRVRLEQFSLGAAPSKDAKKTVDKLLKITKRIQCFDNAIDYRANLLVPGPQLPLVEKVLAVPTDSPSVVVQVPLDKVLLQPTVTITRVEKSTPVSPQGTVAKQIVNRSTPAKRAGPPLAGYRIPKKGKELAQYESRPRPTVISDVPVRPGQVTAKAIRFQNKIDKLFGNVDKLLVKYPRKL